VRVVFTYRYHIIISNKGNNWGKMIVVLNRLPSTSQGRKIVCVYFTEKVNARNGAGN